MNLRTTLLHIATLLSTVTTACTSGGPSLSTDPDAGGGTDGGPTTSSSSSSSGSPIPACGGCNCGSPSSTEGNATPEQACAILDQTSANSGACTAFCGALPGNTKTQSYFCTVAGDYNSAYDGAQHDGGASPDGGATCPSWSGNVVVQCGYPCLGRRTDGVADPTACDPAALGDVFANRAYLEAVSVHAFARLERELASHGAPTSLLRGSRRARREEIRHTAMTMRLARRFGAEPTLPQTPTETPVRSLFEIARENAVEGCIRETYGAVMGLIEARSSSDRDVRDVAERIAADECGHAELAMAVARWSLPRLTPTEQREIRVAMAAAIADLRVRGDARIVDLLSAEVWSLAA
jgi:hypothetical protein